MALRSFDYTPVSQSVSSIISPLFESVSSPGLMTQEAYIVVFTFGGKSELSPEERLSHNDCVSDSLIIMGVSGTMHHRLQRKLEIEF